VVSESMVQSDWPHNHIQKGVTHAPKGKYIIWKKKKQQQGTHPWWEIVENSPSVSQSPTLDKIDKVKHYITIKIHDNIAFRFWD